MAKTKYLTVTGPVKWAFHIFKEGMDTKFGEKFTLQMYPDAKSKLVLKEAGIPVGVIGSDGCTGCEESEVE